MGLAQGVNCSETAVAEIEENTFRIYAKLDPVFEEMLQLGRK